MGSDVPTSRLMELKVVAEMPEVVVPAEPTPEGASYLSNIDQVVNFYVETVYFFKANAAKGVENAAEVLKEALSKLLVPYHFLAGRLTLNAQQMRMEIDCNRAGVLFTSATTDLSISDLGDVSLPNPLFRSLILLPKDANTVSEAPIMTAQVTLFKCGGFCLGHYINHAVVDGVSAVKFLDNWCSIAKGEGLIFPPSSDRTLIRARSPPSPVFDHPEFVKLSDMNANTFATTDAIDAQFKGTSAPIKHVFQVFPFTAQELDTLKQQALRDPSISKCSTFEAIVAHVWQARSKSVEAAPDQQCKLTFAVDFRNRIVPPLPSNYVGNAVVAPLMHLRHADLISGSLSFCVRKIQQSMECVTDEYVRSSIDWWEIYRGVPAFLGGLLVSAWWKIPFDMIDFGWGKPIYAGPVVNDRSEFILLLSNGKRDGGLNIYLALLPEEMAKFEKNIKVSSLI
ncbi:hypothetical protein O6H91_23G006100 [Diphasiastrum complanatum]|uniref:Uncharacterized protein n=1 Tax=Diphasiastrum complanatum TaxID=34168 RepID=A0ACC2A888_DIPCM|nr:hypothetical protein O6H91_Y196300 [Diphasiastrum complanatum]KAJ7295339.1 hypothetical protein O6H91_Y196300 [Diphasiastrum complanatum]KAJ7513606.1 hypothetical protein O6H91_23G006100 [Diphasiastrum complanatum]